MQYLLRAVSRNNLKWPFFDVKMRQNGFFFRNPHEKLVKKMLLKIYFSWSYGGQILGQKSIHTKIDHFTKNCPKSSILSIIRQEITQNYEN